MAIAIVSNKTFSRIKIKVKPLQLSLALQYFQERSVLFVHMTQQLSDNFQGQDKVMHDNVLE